MTKNTFRVTGRVDLVRTAALALSLLVTSPWLVDGLNIAIAGGTGKIGRLLLPKLIDHDVTVLTRNAFLASAPSRVTGVFGYLGAGFLKKNPHVSLRDWDGGDMLDIVGCDFIGWQDDALKKADVVIHMVGGFTEQREKATQRLVSECLRLNRGACHITVNPKTEEIPRLTPGMLTLKTKRIDKCEGMVRDNCYSSKILRVEAFREEAASQEIFEAIQSLV